MAACGGLRHRDEHAFARPWVVQDTDGYRMWFAVRGDRYRIALAESSDGVTWTRRDTLGLKRTGSEWESEMVEYPCVFDWDGRRFMLYNGNGYGRSGVGLAVLDRLLILAGNKPLAGKVALVAGATRGAGRGIAVQLGAAGATVYVTGRTTRSSARPR